MRLLNRFLCAIRYTLRKCRSDRIEREPAPLVAVDDGQDHRGYESDPLFHSVEIAQKYDGYVLMPREDAEQQGYEPCLTCFEGLDDD